MASNRYKTKGKLTKNELINIFEKAEQFYLYGNPWDTVERIVSYPSENNSRLYCTNHEPINQQMTVQKDCATFGATFLFRTIKSKVRIPNFDTITDQNANSILTTFLLSKVGGDDVFSLKYMVATVYLGKRAHNDKHEHTKQSIQNAIDRAQFFDANNAKYLGSQSVFNNQTTKDDNTAEDVATCKKANVARPTSMN